jgi:RNA polymerase sigma-70 factor (ECF subfamily)
VNGLAQIQEAQTPGEDLRLMSLVASGDRRAQRLLVHRLEARVRRIANRLLGSGPDADDASQLALIEILRSAHTFREEASIERWSGRITARTALRHIREKRRGLAMIVPLSDIEDVGSIPPPDSVDEETPRKLQEYLDKLSDPRREALVLKHALGHTTEEIAELTGVPVGTVKDRLIAGRKQLRKMIQRDVARRELGASVRGRTP